MTPPLVKAALTASLLQRTLITESLVRSGRTELSKHWPQPGRQARVRAVKLRGQRDHGGIESTPQLGVFQRPDQRSFQGRGQLRRQQVRALGISRGVAKPQARKGEHLVPDPADPVLGLPAPPPFYADSGVQRVVPGQAGRIAEGWGLR